MKKIIENLNELIKKYHVSGEKKLGNGTLLICNAKHIAPKAWTHSLFAPLNKSEIIDLEKSLGIKIPEVYKIFLENYNGLKLFNRAISFDGWRKNYIRDEENIYQPFDLITPNIHERIKDARQHIFFIGGYSFDGSMLYIDSEKNIICRCNRTSIEPLNFWANLEELIISEITRLNVLFDVTGKKINPNIITIPAPQERKKHKINECIS